MKVVAITQRVVVAPGTGERRDCLAQDWQPFLAAVGVLAVPVPNHPERAVQLAAEFNLAGVILTGGEDIGVFPERDDTELRLLDWAEARALPVIGVCRGMQLMARRAGAQLRPVDPGIHRATRHRVIFNDGCERTVNSYHNIGVRVGDWDNFHFSPLAWCGTDNSLEAMSSGKDLAILWHPEREARADPADVRFFREFLKIENIENE